MMMPVGVLTIVILTVAFSPKRLLAPGLVTAIGVTSFSASTEAVLALLGVYMVSWIVAGFAAED